MRPIQAKERNLSNVAHNSPEPLDGGGTASDVGRIAVTMWQHRVPIVVAALVCGIAAGVAASLRADRWVGVVDLAVGYVPPVERLVNPAELAQRLRSPSQVLRMSGMERCIVKDEAAELPPDCPRHLALESEVIENTAVVTLTAETSSAEQSGRLVDRVTEKILAEHDRLFNEVKESNQRNIEEFEKLLARLEADLSDRTSARRGAAPLPGADAEAMSVWSQLVAVRQHLEMLRSQNLAARARPTRAVAGPEVERKRRIPPPAAAAFLGAFVGVAVATLVLAMRRAIAERR